MLLFRSEEEVSTWCAATGTPRGETVELPRMWELAQRWYGDRMDPAFRGRTVEQAREIFAGVGLTSAFWQGGAER
jgi:hypothetical protein